MDAGDLPSGLGEVCKAEEDCAGFDADYCAMDPAAGEGFCTITDCSPNPDDCPEGYLCCAFIITSVPYFCTTEADHAAMGGMCGGD